MCLFARCHATSFCISGGFTSERINKCFNTFIYCDGVIAIGIVSGIRDPMDRGAGILFPGAVITFC